MARICVQMGHAEPCGRTRPCHESGTVREKEWTKIIGPMLTSRLIELGHRVALIGMDATQPNGWDHFVSLHIDAPNVTGPSAGYPGPPYYKVDQADAHAAALWKKYHVEIAGYNRAPFKDDNHYKTLPGYYMWPRTQGYKTRFLAEHGRAVVDESWLFHPSSLHGMVEAHVAVVGDIYGHPKSTPTPPSEEDDMPAPNVISIRDDDNFDKPRAEGAVVGDVAVTFNSERQRNALIDAGVIRRDEPLPAMSDSEWKSLKAQLG